MNFIKTYPAVGESDLHGDFWGESFSCSLAVCTAEGKVSSFSVWPLTSFIKRLLHAKSVPDEVEGRLRFPCVATHQNRVSAIIFSLSTEWVISTGHDKCVSWMCTRSGNMLGRHFFTSWASCLQIFKYDFDTQYAFVGDYSGQITLLKLEQNTCSVITTLKGHEAWLNDPSYTMKVVVSPASGGTLFSGYSSQEHLTTASSCGTSEEEKAGRSYFRAISADKVQSLCYLQLTRQLVSCSSDGGIAVWNMDVSREESYSERAENSERGCIPWKNRKFKPPSDMVESQISEFQTSKAVDISSAPRFTIPELAAQWRLQDARVAPRGRDLLLWLGRKAEQICRHGPYPEQLAPQWLESDSCQKCEQPFFWNIKQMWDTKTLGLRQRETMCCKAKVNTLFSSSRSPVKHHCRKCGQAVCGKCSSKRSSYPVMGFEFQVRVCDSCYDSIKDEETEPPFAFFPFESAFKAAEANIGRGPNRKASTSPLVLVNELVMGLEQLGLGAELKPMLRTSLATFHEGKHNISHMSMDVARGLMVTCGTDRIVKIWDMTPVVGCSLATGFSPH
ncbi:hypothetical protein P7K49_013529 [Saguinus oedipus]|uniref:FYVE-type domain-containing protein n=1 Tax=Saguinus oedipus TaxID=9490 RepID=A0ABQ9VG78_SAGOE|nr:hypothetical protein P7K49_013529 [Saguinus oedipus]